jgi:hypothetical protein
MATNLDLYFKDDCDYMIKLDIKNNLFYLASADDISVYPISGELIEILSISYTLTTEEEYKKFTQNTPVGYVSTNIIFDRNTPLSLLFNQNQFAVC